MTHNIRLTIQYDGTNYAGWQFQKNARSVQEIIEVTLYKIIGKVVRLTAAGRTDAGVHAKGQIANFRTDSSISPKNLQKALNSILPKDIIVSRIKEVGLRFNSQRDAKSKLYRYVIVNNDFVYPFIRRFAAKCFYKIDVSSMRRAARYLVGRHDFRSFQTKDGEGKYSVRTVKKIRIEKDQDLIYIDIEADGFLYNMARSIVGTLIEVGRGKLPVDGVEEILRRRDRRHCGPTAPAKGLCLVRVNY